MYESIFESYAIEFNYYGNRVHVKHQNRSPQYVQLQMIGDEFRRRSTKHDVLSVLMSQVGCVSTSSNSSDKHRMCVLMVALLSSCNSAQHSLAYEAIEEFLGSNRTPPHRQFLSHRGIVVSFVLVACSIGITAPGDLAKALTNWIDERQMLKQEGCHNTY
jgi:hypothetical protein